MQFSEPVTGFDSADVVLGGTAGATTVVVTGSGAVYDIAVTGMSTAGTVTASIPAGAAVDAIGTDSLASISLDNTVTYEPPVATTTTLEPATTTTLEPATTTTFVETTTSALVSPTGDVLPATGSGSSSSGVLTAAATLVASGIALMLVRRRVRSV
ncbi:MAG TPA: LPXTG cell wall anchor domain-containing protein [Ilumatobacteraceae bacterium]|nr:LPXTG cell wall anchor domain-containing protein [Ilumatobacteraceae bacterium]